MSTAEEILLLKGPDVVSTSPDTTVRQAVHKMAESRVGCLIVEQGGLPVGIFTERDLLTRIVDAGKDPDATRVEQVMTSPVATCSPTDSIRKCIRILAGRNFRHLAVEKNDRIVGVISFRDLLTLELSEARI